MDAALELRIAFERGNIKSHEQAQSFLRDSELVRELTSSFERKPLYAVWRVIALSEIPFASSLDYANRVIEYIAVNLSTTEGFSLTGKATDLLPCYNAMLIEALSKLGKADTPAVQNAVEWIKKYQPFERKTAIHWTGVGVKKYGGCLKSTPCFIGVAKSVKALVAYDKATGHKDGQIVSLITKGMEYILKHELYKRLSNKEPINKHILDLAFPACYQLNIVELLELAYSTGYIKAEGCQSALELVNRKKTKDGYWKINYVYHSEGYKSFDQRGNKADWLTYFLNKFITNQEDHKTEGGQSQQSQYDEFT